MAPRGFSFGHRIHMAFIRSTVFVDGNNWYHGLRSLGLDSVDLDYQRLAKKLLMGRRLQEIRYYVGKVSGDLPRVRAQERSLAALRQQGVVVELGRIERNLMPADRNPLAARLRQLLAAERDAVPPGFAEQLDALCAASIPYFVEKQVDVRIAVDMVGMAYRSEYDVAYLLSADGDFVPAVREVQKTRQESVCGKPLQGPPARQGRRRIRRSTSKLVPRPPPRLTPPTVLFGVASQTRRLSGNLTHFGASSRTVTGPSFTSATCMSAPNSPVRTAMPRSSKPRT